MANKRNLIFEMLEDGMTAKEIKEALDEEFDKPTKLQYIYNTKNQWKKTQNDDEEGEDEDGEGEETEGDYTARVPKERRKAPKKETYQCGACGEEWESKKDPKVCPFCGSEFD